MALQNQLSIANGALIKLGEPEISAISSSSADQASRLIDERWTPCLQYLLRRHIWNFAVVRKKLTAADLTNRITVTGITAADPPVVTAAGHAFTTGDTVTIKDAGGMTEINGLPSVVTAATTFSMDDLDSSAYTTYTSAGYAFLTPAFDFTYYHDLPSDCLYLNQVEQGDIQHRVEGRRIASNSETLEIKYIRDIAVDELIMDSTFTETLAAYIAMNIALALTQDKTLRSDMKTEFLEAIRIAKHTNAIEEPAEELRTYDWVDSRFNTAGGINRTPIT